MSSMGRLQLCLDSEGFVIEIYQTWWDRELQVFGLARNQSAPLVCRLCNDLEYDLKTVISEWMAKQRGQWPLCFMNSHRVRSQVASYQ